DCPVLQRRLHGTEGVERASEEKEEKRAGVYCGNCQTNLEWVKMGNPLGCPECYDVFSDVILSDLLKTEKIPSRLKKSLKRTAHLPLHAGKSLQEILGVTPSKQLTSLHEALKEALKKENYEQAAWLRDQIKALQEKKENDK
ncbi:MAG: hypothetical protein A3D18_04015, partial [Chlamydiae bacterium RIFCSPHIGHO2_02_FULL_49_29]